MRTWKLLGMWAVLAALVFVPGCGQKSGMDAADMAADAYDGTMDEMEEMEEYQDDYGDDAAGGTGRSAAAGTPTGRSAASGGSETSGGTTSPVARASSRRMLTLPAGKNFKTTLDTSMSSKTSQVGDPFSATVRKPVHLQGGKVVAVEKGARIEGTVIEVESAKRVKGLARLGLQFDSLVLLDGTRVDIRAGLSEKAAKTKKRDAATIAGGAAAGAVLGRVLGDDGKDALKGAVIGGAIGTGVVLGTKGKEVELEAGTELILELVEPVDVPVTSSGA